MAKKKQTRFPANRGSEKEKRPGSGRSAPRGILTLYYVCRGDRGAVASNQNN